ncbi:TPA: hypothetical protein ACS70L_003301 [Providencia alcalifaciens]
MKKIQRLIISLPLYFFYSINSLAVNVGNITEILSSDENSLAKEIENTVGTARLVNLTIDKISSPLEDGQIIPISNHNEILSTPSNLILPGKTKDVFKIIYQGPEDDKERYYRLNWKDEPIGEIGATQSQKSALATTSATISTIFVVAPRIEKFRYKYTKSRVSNIGNSSFRIAASGPCLTNKQKFGIEGFCRERYYLMPNLSVELQFVDLEDRRSSIGIWHKGEFIVIK